MIRSKIIVFSLFLLGVFKSNSQQLETGWKSLFNGKDLTGFKQLNGKASYEVKNGEIIGTNVPNEPNSFLATIDDYGDFVLELELLVDTAMNSGVQFRSQSLANFKDGRVHGYQMEIDPSERAWSGAIFDEGRRGWLYTTDLNPAAKTAFKNNQWNKYRIECIGNTIRTWVNNVPAAHLIDNMTPSGFIALQVHAVRKGQSPGKQIRWRNIRIKMTDLKPSPYDDIFVVNLIPNNISAQEKKLGFRFLWDGKTSKGWSSVNNKVFPSDKWKLKDGVLTNAGGDNSTYNPTDIVTKDKFSAFELKFDFRLSKGASSGVQYLVENNGKQAIGLEYQLIDDSTNPAAKNDKHKLASLYDLIPSNVYDPRFIRRTGEWNEAVIKVQSDSKVEYWLNGMKVLEYTIGSEQLGKLISQSSYKGIDSFGKLSKGAIMLKDEGSEISFRSIKIRKLN